VNRSGEGTVASGQYKEGERGGEWGTSSLQKVVKKGRAAGKRRGVGAHGFLRGGTYHSKD